MEPQDEATRAAPESKTEQGGRCFAPRSRRKQTSGQAIVEFAIVSVAFFMMVFGTIDFGRAIYMYSQLNNAVREGARYGKMNPTDTSGIKSRVISYASALNLTTSNITVVCTGGCTSSSSDVKVTANASFTAITQDLLGLGPITLSSSAKVNTE